MVMQVVRRQRRKEARPAEIIEAGMREFAEHGFARTKLDDVAKRAGIAKGTIYRYFESKEALFEAALKSHAGPLFDDIERVIEAFPGSSASLIRTVIPQIYRELFASDLHILMRIIIAESSRFPAIAEFYHRESIQRGQKLLGLIIRRGIASGEFRDGPVAELPMIVVAPALMAAVWKMTFDAIQPIPMETFTAAHIDLILNGLLVPAK